MTQSEQIQAAVKAGSLMPSAAANISAYLAANLPAWAQSSIGELVGKGSWGDFNDRFYRELEFGTGGIRGNKIPVFAIIPINGPATERSCHCVATVLASSWTSADIASVFSAIAYNN